MIPGVNDDEEHIRAVLEFIRPHPNVVMYELLPYHRYGETKYGFLGRVYELKDFESLSSETLHRLQAIIDEVLWTLGVLQTFTENPNTRESDADMDEILQKIMVVTIIIFMVGNLLEVGLRLKVVEALAALRNARFVCLFAVVVFCSGPRFGHSAHQDHSAS